MKQSYIVAFWSPLAASHPHFCLDFFIPFLQKYGDIQCLDLQSRQDARTIRLLRQANLVIIGLPPIPAAFRRYFCDNWIPFSNVCYAFLDYLPALQTDIRRICQHGAPYFKPSEQSGTDKILSGKRNTDLQNRTVHGLFQTGDQGKYASVSGKPADTGSHHTPNLLLYAAAYQRGGQTLAGGGVCQDAEEGKELLFL